ncbi:MAG: hypothetical protein ABIY51_08625 [Ferruginibacter sp.]
MKTNKPIPPLIFCLLMDLIGCASFSIPFIGEFSDIIWAPLSAIIFYKTFGSRMGIFGGAFSFIEELLPFTDIIPTFTISWFIRYRAQEKNNMQNISQGKLLTRNNLIQSYK